MHQYRNIACHVRNSTETKVWLWCCPKKNVHILDHNFRFSNMDKLTVTLSIDAIRTTTPQHIRLLNIWTYKFIDSRCCAGYAWVPTIVKALFVHFPIQREWQSMSIAILMTHSFSSICIVHLSRGNKLSKIN